MGGGRGDQERDTTPAFDPNQAFEAQYNVPNNQVTDRTGQQGGTGPAPNPLFEDYARTQNAPQGDGRGVVIPSGARVEVDGQMIPTDGTGNVIIEHAENVNVFYGGRQVPRQVADFERNSGAIQDDYPHRTQVRIGNRPLYSGPVWDGDGQIFNQMRRRGGGQVVYQDEGYGPGPAVVSRDSTTYGGRNGVVFRDNTTVIGDGGVVTSGNGGFSGRDLAALGIAILDSPNLPMLFGHGHGGGRGQRYGGYDRGRSHFGINIGFGNRGYDDYPMYRTPPFVPQRGGQQIVYDTDGPATVYDSSRTTAGGPNGVVFRDSTTVVGNGGVISENPNNFGWRDLAAVGVAVLDSPNLPWLVGKGDNYHGNYNGGGYNYRPQPRQGNFYGQQMAAERRAVAQQRYQSAQQRMGRRPC